jgi:hypothetical protein
MEQLEVGVQGAQDSSFVFFSKTGTKEKENTYGMTGEQDRGNFCVL